MTIVHFDYTEAIIERTEDRVVTASVRANDLLIMDIQQVFRDGEDVSVVRRAASLAIERHIGYLPKLKPGSEP